ncbi:MAG: U32 family peptidase [Oscillospiraceae bacterium]|jgi:putative protease|nr:U32 family peptidase [Oscillospiraceae bacterium]
MIEILSPAGSPEGVTAAVQNGADAVYMGFSAFNARRGAKNFTADDFARAAEYCRVRGVKTYLTLNTLVTDRELPAALDTAVTAAKAGADAIIIADLGLMRAVHSALPDMPLHCSTQMGIHNSEGARIVAAMGASRVVLARELPREDIESIARSSPVELEVFVHGAYCVSHSGQCYFSSVIGRRSGNRGACAQPCRLPYSGNSRKSEYPLSLKDNCLVSHLEELEKAGVKSLKIEGRMKRPEYAAIVTGVYAKAAHEHRDPTAEELNALESAFSRQGFTDGYYTKNLGESMLGVREETTGDAEIFRSARRNYLHGEFQRVPVKFVAELKTGVPARLVAFDDRGNRAAAQGAVPEPAFHRETNTAQLSTQLHKTGGTPFFCEAVKCRVDPGLALPVAAINEMRREVLAALFEQRRASKQPKIIDFDATAAITPAPTPDTAVIVIPPSPEPPVFTVSITKSEQLSNELLVLAPRLLYIPLAELRHTAKLKPFLASPDIMVAAIMPRVVFDSEWQRTYKILEAARKIGITDILCGNLGQVLPLREMGFTVRGDFGLNIFSSHALLAARDLGLASATLSFEMSLPQINDAVKPLDTELLAYGRLPLMLTENCVIKSSSGSCTCGSFSGLSDRTGANFPVIRENADSCRNVVLNSKKLFLADRLPDFLNLGVWGLRLAFTTENAAECVSVMRRYAGDGAYEPGGFTRGLYYKGVE